MRRRPHGGAGEVPAVSDRAPVSPRVEPSAETRLPSSCLEEDLWFQRLHGDESVGRDETFKDVTSETEMDILNSFLSFCGLTGAVL